MRISVYFGLILFLLSSCTHTQNTSTTETDDFMRGSDLSALPEIESDNVSFYNNSGEAEDALAILKAKGLNTVRIRIWNNPPDGHNGFEEVKIFASKVHAMGLKVYLTVHYSDHWADPGQQEPPAAWQGLSFEAVKDSVYVYTSKIMTEIQPDYIQIGNEINPGFLLPYGDINTNLSQFKELLSTGIQAVRSNSSSTKIMIHYAGMNGADAFFSKLTGLDYDIIGLSYYPKWHGKDLDAVANTLQQLSETYTKDIAIAETAYPFTLGWNDWTNNIVGENDLVPGYPATEQGQKDFLERIRSIVENNPRGIGFCYWGGELVAYKGNEATDGSPWENQALFDFNNKVLPVANDFIK